MVKLSVNNANDNNRNECVEYPLKIIELDEYLLNPDEFMWSNVSKSSTQMLNHLEISNFKDETTGETINVNYEKRFESKSYDDNEWNSSSSSSSSSLSSSMSNKSTTLLFMDSKAYRELFNENKSSNNLIVMDRQINFYSIDEIDNYLQLFANSQRILLHGVIKSKLNNQNNDNSQKKINKKNDINKNNDFTNVLFMLNSNNDFVKTNLIDGLTNLKENFTNGRRAIFEVNFIFIIYLFFFQLNNLFFFIFNFKLIYFIII